MSGNAVNKLLKEIKKYVKQNSALLVACSGGADSAALTDALWQLKEVRIRRRLPTHYGSLKMNAAIK